MFYNWSVYFFRGRLCYLCKVQYILYSFYSVSLTRRRLNQYIHKKNTSGDWKIFIRVVVISLTIRNGFIASQTFKWKALISSDRYKTKQNIILKTESWQKKTVYLLYSQGRHVHNGIDSLIQKAYIKDMTVMVPPWYKCTFRSHNRIMVNCEIETP